MSQPIPFNKPSCAGKEQEYIAEAIRIGHLSGDGDFTRKVRKLLKEELQAASVLPTTSCTHALEMSALLLDIQPGDEVIVPSFTFVSTVNAFVLRGAKPVFVDIRRDTKNLDESLIQKSLSAKTKAIVPVHYAGIGCEMEAICAIAQEHGLAVVEDNAHGIFGKYKGRLLGSFGQLSTLSFHETKNLQCGEGGALVINDPALAERAEIIREKGTNRARFFRGQIDKYSWVDVGSSYLPSEILVAYLLAQLEKKDEIQNRRQQIWHAYASGLAEWAAASKVEMPFVPSDCDQSYHMFYIMLPNLVARQALIDHLKRQNILSVFHYLPLHTSEMGRKMGFRPGDCPVTEDISDRILRLPFYTALSDHEQSRVIEAVKEFSFSETNLPASSAVRR
jgi:dTDP-4-amino-4,6-dideoxygalactose transaminase